jgi:hydroxyacylglutathione hydrolase
VLVAGFPAGPWATNCWVVAPGRGSECVIIDPGKDVAADLQAVLREHQLLPVAVLLTHGHIDHMWSVTPVSADYGIPAYVHPDDRDRLADPWTTAGAAATALREMSGGTLTFQEPAEVRELSDSDELDLAGVRLLVRHAPGHTAGSVAFAHDNGDDRLIFSGDLLFAGSVGRTDLPGGNSAAMVDSLARVCLTLPDDTVVCPGHGDRTTIGRERATNPYLLQLSDFRQPGRGL